MQCFSLSHTTSEQLDRIHRNFFCKNSPSETGIPLIAWDTVRKPKTKGGLGLRRTQSIYKVYQCKLAWRLLNNEPSIWVQTLRAKYRTKFEFLQYKRKGLESSAWKSLLKCRPLPKQEIRWKVGKGVGSHFGLIDNWIDNSNHLDMLNLQVELVHRPYATIAEFITAQKQWNLAKLNQVIQDHAIIQKI